MSCTADQLAQMSTTFQELEAKYAHLVGQSPHSRAPGTWSATNADAIDSVPYDAKKCGNISQLRFADVLPG